MGEFIYTSPKPLVIPEKCLGCPVMCIIKDEAEARNVGIERDVATALTDDEKQHYSRQRFLKKYIKLTGVEAEESLLEKRQRLSQVLDEQEDDQLGDQVEIDEHIEACDGPAVVNGVTPLGRQIVVTVCGSEAYSVNTDRFLVGPGHGQVQHEQVHVERLLHPGELAD